MTDTHDGGPAFPLVIEEEGCIPQVHKGMSLRQYAAIKLRVPDSGTGWLDDMIRDARRMDYAGQALAGILANPSRLDSIDNTTGGAYTIADAMIAARSEAKQ